MKNNWGLLLLFIAVPVCVWVLTRKHSSTYELMPEQSYRLIHGSVKNYSNKEEWDISYSEDGLPTHISITRNAVRS